MPDQVAVSTNKNFDTPFIRINYSSLTTPNRWLDMDMSNLDSKVDHKSIGAGITINLIVISISYISNER